MRAFLSFLGLILGALLLGALLAYPGWRLLHPHFDFAFHRISSRVAMLALLVGFVLLARRFGVADRTSLGYGLPRRVFVREMVRAVLLGAVLMLPIVILMGLMGLRHWQDGAMPGAGTLASVALQGLLTGLTVAFIEETFLRGAMFTAVQREAGAVFAIVSTAIVYSALHFFARAHIDADQVTWSSGFTLLASTLHTFADPLGIADAFLCLFAVGVLLGAVRQATGSIAACIGLHAGWVWIIQIVRETTVPDRTHPASFLLSAFDGIVGWMVLAWTVVIGLALQRLYARRTA